MQTIRDDDSIWLNTFSDFIENFVMPSERERLYYVLSKPKRRHEILGYFHTDILFDSKCLCPIPPAPAERSVDEIGALMKKLGATSQCFVFSFIEALDGEVELKTALRECVGFCTETILYCSKSKVAYWEGGHCDRWILCKY